MNTPVFLFFYSTVTSRQILTARGPATEIRSSAGTVVTTSEDEAQKVARINARRAAPEKEFPELKISVVRAPSEIVYPLLRDEEGRVLRVLQEGSQTRERPQA